MEYIIGIDQSTQGTKAVLVDEQGRIAGRADRKHAQLVNEQGWVSHDPEEIYQNVLLAVQDVMKQNQIPRESVRAIGISNQRETTVLWDRQGRPLAPAIVWQCGRARDIAQRLEPWEEAIRRKTGLPLSPFFPAAKMAWLLEQNASGSGCGFCLGTVDSWLIYRLTGGKSFKTDYSNASRTQLFNLHTLEWDQELCQWFGVPMEALPKVCDSNSAFGETTLEGYFEKPVPILAALGDSHGALFAHGCHQKGMTKTTYGTGSSIMMNIGTTFQESRSGLATSLAWGMDGVVHYVLEGNINYTGAVMSWLKDDLKLIAGLDELNPAIEAANPADTTVLVPAFTGLSAPYWDHEARGLIYGMSRTTGRNEIIRGAVESIALQIMDVVKSMERDSGISIEELHVDGGPTRNGYLMQFQSDMTGSRVLVPEMEEFSALGAAYMAGLTCGMYRKETLFEGQKATVYERRMEAADRERKQQLWQQAIHACRGK
ncbi:MAG: glycerol kinase GlpK [Lachnospiraceae bacterium]|nr:glycerol kinase GlpK [Lachnospiraceae bacterium]